jgi:hypothetical protein
MFRRLLVPWIVIPILALVYGLFVMGRYGNTAALVTPGLLYAPPEFADQLYSEEGYDGQFTYNIARYGWSAAPLVDLPAYRMQRILLPALARPFASWPNALPVMLFAINIIALAAGTWAFERLLIARRVSRWYALGVMASLGMLGATRLNTAEPLAYALVIGGLLLCDRQQWAKAAGLFALAALSKETTLIIPFAIGLYHLARRDWRNAILGGIVALLPFIAWQIILYTQFGTWGAGSGGAMATPFEIIPFRGVIRILTEGNPSVFVTLMIVIAPFVILPVVWSLWRVWKDRRLAQTSLTWWLLLAAAALMLFVPFSTYREWLGILRFIVGLQIALVLYAAERHQRRALLYSTLWAFTTVIVIWGDVANPGIQ